METREKSDTYINEMGVLCNGPFPVLCVVEFQGFYGFVTSSENQDE